MNRWWVAAFASLALLVAACGDDDGAPDSTRPPAASATATGTPTPTPQPEGGSGSPQESIGMQERITITITDPE
jgi:hypothetical protein